MRHSGSAGHMEVYSQCDDTVFQIALCSRDRGMGEVKDEEHFIRTKKQWFRVAVKIALLPASWGRKLSNSK